MLKYSQEYQDQNPGDRVDKYKRGEFYITCIVQNLNVPTLSPWCSTHTGLESTTNSVREIRYLEDRARLALQEILKVLWNQIIS
jgi:hypothetical protein